MIEQNSVASQAPRPGIKVDYAQVMQNQGVIALRLMGLEHEVLSLREANMTLATHLNELHQRLQRIENVFPAEEEAAETPSPAQERVAALAAAYDEPVAKPKPKKQPKTV